MRKRSDTVTTRLRKLGVKLNQQIGEGGFGTVFVHRDPSRVVKVSSRSEDEYIALCRLLNKKLKNVVRIDEVHLVEYDLVVVMEKLVRLSKDDTDLVDDFIQGISQYERRYASCIAT